MAKAGRRIGGFSCSVLVALSLLLSAGNVSAASASPISLEASTTLSKEGYLDFHWSGAPVAGDVALMIATDPDFQQPIWQNSLLQQSAVSVSGLSNGAYYARISVNNQANGEVIYSNTVTFKVKHHSLLLAGLLFAIGVALFLLLARTVWRYSRDDTRNYPGEA